MPTITSIKLARDRPIPHSTKVKILDVGDPLRIDVSVMLPWQKTWKHLGLIPLVGTEIILPLKLAFLCHAKEDKESVEAVGSKLLEDGFLTWYDDKDLRPGDDWQAVIEREISGCDFFLAFLSSKSLSKIGYVNRELRYAMQQRELRPLGVRFILPVLIDECTLPRELSHLHFVRLWEADAYEKLAQTMTSEA